MVLRDPGEGAAGLWELQRAMQPDPDFGAEREGPQRKIAVESKESQA